MNNQISRVVFFLAIFTISPNLFADVSCEQVNCDCATVDSKQAREVCKKQEAWVKAQCKNERSKNYCGDYGAKYSSLALRLNIAGDLNPMVVKDIKKTHKKVATMYWAIHSDSDVILEKVKYKKYLDAKSMLKNIEMYLDEMFQLQQHVSMSWIHHGKPENAIRAWRDYSEDTLNAARDLAELSDAMVKRIKGGGVSYQVYEIASISMKLSGYAYEIAGYSFGQAEKNEQAAKSWVDAAGQSRLLVDQGLRKFSDADERRFYTVQSASRMHRASVYWTKAKKQNKAKEVLDESESLYANAR